MKACFKCGAEKPLADFYKHAQMADGHLNKCKLCAQADARARRFDPRSRERVLAYDRQRGSRQDYGYVVAYRESNPEKYRAHSRVANAIRSGALERPESCSHCKKVTKPHAHHEDYSKPLDVVWLCDECHRNLHALYETVGRKIEAF